MFFLELFMTLTLAFGAPWMGFDFSDSLGVDNEVGQHTIHGHLPAPPDTHPGFAAHVHHGQHGHTAGPSGHEFFH